MNILKKLAITSSLLTLTLMVLCTSSPAQAALFNASKNEACKGANLSSSNSKCDSAGAADKVSTTLKRIIDLLTVIVGIAVVIVIIVSGLKLITSGGDSNAITSARNGIIYALIGLIIVALFAGNSAVYIE